MSKVNPADSADLKIMSSSPLVAGIPLSGLDQQVTPTDRFFVRNHFATPVLDPSDWTLEVFGKVRHRLSLSYESLKALPSKEVTVLLECAGNSRAAIQPPIEGLLWDHGGVGSARWTGVPLRIVLEQAGLLANSKEVVLVGADRGVEHGASNKINFSMSLTMDKALHTDTLLAYHMNGEDLTPEHGYPLRVVTPGWFGMASVKWLTGIEVIAHPFQGFHRSEYYVFVDEGPDDDSPKERVTSMPVKSLISWPERGDALSVGAHSVRGVAWSGQGPISTVEVSTDMGQTWHAAKLEDTESPHTWQRWCFLWNADQPGHYLVRARATDVEGNCQPTQFKWNFRGFANNAIHAVPVEIRA